MSAAPRRRLARGRPPAKLRGRMNGLESRYALHLESQKRHGQIVAYGYEELKLRLADGAWYCPDFWVQAADEYLEIHEVKGHWEEAARVRIKVASERFAIYRFVAVTAPRRGAAAWRFETFGQTELPSPDGGG